ncbi:MAG: serine/threonine protein kinase [Deltaproteobacteria bacterium]|nr:serine/threonine protein kinase [Deltaproteobacteria bacterium]
MTEIVRFGNYVLLGRLSLGGMAEVSLGRESRDTGGERLLAIKRVLPHLRQDPAFAEMFRDESRIAAALAHPNICRIYEHGEADEQLFIAMEFIHGKELRILIKQAAHEQTTVPNHVAAFIAVRIAEALDFAHSRHNEVGQPSCIVHRDVSASNILISCDGVPKLIDFGIAVAKHRIASTHAGQLKGNYGYMSPEQISCEPVTAQSDIFSLGVVLYEMITGKLPFCGSNEYDLVGRIVATEYTPPSEINGAVPERLAAVVERALQLDPNRRYVRAGAMAADLSTFLMTLQGAVTEMTVARYMRRLFRGQCEAENQTLAAYKAIKLPQPTPAGQSRERRPPPLPGAGVSQITDAAFLAAGYGDTGRPRPPRLPEAVAAVSPAETIQSGRSTRRLGAGELDALAEALKGPKH